MYTPSTYIRISICSDNLVHSYPSLPVPRRQHWKDVADASSRHVMEELGLLHPQALGIDMRYLTAKSGPKYSSTLKKLVVKYVDSHVRQVLQSGRDPLLDLLHKIRSSVKTSGEIHFITSSHLSTNEGGLSSFVARDNSDVTPFLDQPLPPLKDMQEEGRLDVQQVFGGSLAITSVKDPDQLRLMPLCWIHTYVRTYVRMSRAQTRFIETRCEK